jgi:hypothetical protein
MNVRTDDRIGIVSQPTDQRRHDDSDIRLDAGHSPQPSNGHYQHVHELPPCREGIRLLRLPDWVEGGPFWIVASTNGRILRLGLGYNAAADYLSQLAIPVFQVDMLLYQADRWARRLGSQPPLYGLRESDRAPCFDVLCEVEVSKPAERTPSTYGAAVTSV